MLDVALNEIVEDLMLVEPHGVVDETTLVDLKEGVLGVGSDLQEHFRCDIYEAAHGVLDRVVHDHLTLEVLLAQGEEFIDVVVREDGGGEDEVAL